ncbi:hypothetical protein [Xenorhabdus sp. PB30.3]|uniref:hypothetical protein n=1 Tax=Xenorhabdus sp. PB30.3 TaxID=2788941 RepID=UPI001E63BD79|nr:hypothetical protein [Xenorhabdus sp. PB30.3]MCC8381809.1 hypothetical protein [Xenorhabdus sp. PB30.3]
MKKYKWLILIFTALICSISANAVADKCGEGYVTGLWVNWDNKNDWGVWLSDSGGSWYSKSIAYTADKQLYTDTDSGKSAYAAILAAQANGQKVALHFVGACKNKVFSVVETWSP